MDGWVVCLVLLLLFDDRNGVSIAIRDNDNLQPQGLTGGSRADHLSGPSRHDRVFCGKRNGLAASSLSCIL
jgi:hypothetical protein